MKNKTLIILLILSNLILSCKKDNNNLGEISKGKINDEQMLFEYGIYYTPDSHMTKSEVINIIEKKYSEFKILDSIPEPGNFKGSQIVIKEIKNVKDEFTAPDINYLKYCSKGLSEQQKEIIQTSNFVIILNFLCTEEKLLSTIEKSNKLITELLISNNDIIWDSETRECFTKEYWNKHRLIYNNSINISNHITIHLYPKDDQTLLDKKNIETKGKLSLDIDLLSNQELKSNLLNSLLDNAEKKATINIKQGVWEKGDAQNRILEIAFPKNNPQIKQDELVTKIFGSKDEVTYLNHNDELIAASEKSKEKIPELYKRFSKGMPVGDHLLIKFPFEDLKGGKEWMWVEIIKWEGKTIKGLLKNDPHIVKSLKAGEEVTKNIDNMFDYILYFADGTEEGNETEKIILKHQQK